MPEGQKAIFVTGAASGIGRAVAVDFAKRGWFAGLADVDEAGMAETAAMIPEGQSSVHRLDVRDRSGWDVALAAFAERNGGRLDVLFNNAGIGSGGPFETVSHDDHDRMIDINIKGVVWGAEAGFRYLAATPDSCLLNTASAAGIYGPANIAVYGATKFAVRGLSEALDAEWSRHGIRVRSLMPGFIDTAIIDAVEAQSNQTVRERLKAQRVEILPVSKAVEAAWKAIHGKSVHTQVGRMARMAWLFSRFAPSLLRREFRQLTDNAQG